MGAVPFLPLGGPFDGPKDQCALLRYTEGVDLLASEFLPEKYETWPDSWRGAFRLRGGGEEDVHQTGIRAGETPTYVLECEANGYVLTKARIYDDRIVAARVDEGSSAGSESGRPGAAADADTFDLDAFDLHRVEAILGGVPAASGVDDDIDPEYADSGVARGAVAYGVPGDSAAKGRHIRNPFYFAVPATSSSAASSSASLVVKAPLHHLLR